MKKLFIIALAILAISLPSSAQKGMNSLGVSFGMAGYDIEGFKTPLAFGLKYQHQFTDHFRFSGEGSYFGFVSGAGGGIVTVNGHYIFSNNRFKPYVGLGLGVLLGESTNEKYEYVIYNYYYNNYSSGTSEKYFNAPGILYTGILGFDYRLTERFSIALEAKVGAISYFGENYYYEYPYDEIKVGTKFFVNPNISLLYNF